jgi:hypothetical protein
VYRRHAIMSDPDLREAARKLTGPISAQQELARLANTATIKARADELRCKSMAFTNICVSREEFSMERGAHDFRSLGESPQSALLP